MVMRLRLIGNAFAAGNFYILAVGNPPDSMRHPYCTNYIKERYLICDDSIVIYIEV